MHATSVDWKRVRSSLSEAARRVARLLRRVRDPGAPGTGDWSAAETAAHLSHSFAANLSTVRGSTSDLPADLSGPTSEVLRVADYNDDNLELDPERDLATLAARIEATASEFLAATQDSAPDQPVTWLRGAKLPISALACHWIGESLLHGFDIARGNGLPWTVDPGHAALWFAGMAVPAVEGFDERALVDQEKAAGLRARVDMRVRGAARVLFVLEDGKLHVEGPAGKADCHVSIEPATNLLLSWGRIGPLRAMAGGRLVVWGRRPMQSLRLTRVLTQP